jgi:hypothetical protein
MEICKIMSFLNFQYGVSADIYSLTTILYELFSGTDSFPGTIGQIFEAKKNNTKPEIPSDFPALLKDLICHGWSQEPKERPNLEVFKFVLTTMLRDEGNAKAQSQNENEKLAIQAEDGTSSNLESPNQTMEENPSTANLESCRETMEQNAITTKLENSNQTFDEAAKATILEASNQTLEEDTTTTNLESSSEVIQAEDAITTNLESSIQTFNKATKAKISIQTIKDDATTTKSLEDQKENPKFQRSPKLAHNQIRKGKDTSANITEMATEQKEKQRTKVVEESQRREPNEKHETQNKGKTEKSNANLCYKKGHFSIKISISVL